MAKTPQIIVMTPPNELVFKGPFHEIVSSRLNLSNPTTNRVGFKVKTTAPRRYCVRPNSGIIEPNSNVNVVLMLQPFEFDPQEKNKHKFMVQTLIAPDEDVNLESLFKEYASTPGRLMDSKLRCVFEMPPKEDGEQQTTETSTDVDTAQSVQPRFGAAGGDAPRSVPKAAPTVPSSEKIPAEEQLKVAAQDLKNLRSENSSLKQELLSLKEELLRERNAKSSGGSTSATVINLPEQSMAYTSTHMIIAFAIALASFIFGKWIL